MIKDSVTPNSKAAGLIFQAVDAVYAEALETAKSVKRSFGLQSGITSVVTKLKESAVKKRKTLSARK